MVKDFGKLSAEQFRRFIDLLPGLQAAQRELQTHLAALPKARLDEVFKADYNWAALYELPFVTHLAVAAVALNQGAYLAELASSPDPQQRLLDEFDSEQITEHNPEFEKQHVVGLVVSINKTTASLMKHGRSLSAMVQDVREKDDLDALFEVVRMDRAAVACPSIADRIARAELTGNESFMKRLAHALKGPSKKYWGGDFDRLRYALALLREMGINDLSGEELEKLMVETLGVYPDVASARRNLQAQYLQSRKTPSI